MGILYIAGQGPRAGATSFAASLAALWKRRGLRVIATKPLAFPGDGRADADDAFLSRLSSAGADGSPAAIDANDPDEALLDDTAERLKGLATDADVVIVEGLPRLGPDGAAAPVSPLFAERLGAKVLGVLRYDRGTDARTAVEWRETYASLLAGVVLNRRTRYAEHDAPARVVPAFEDAGVSVIGTVPEQRLLLAPTVRQVVELLDGTFYSGLSGEEQLIEHFLIGGLITEWGGNYFNRLQNQAVLVRGGRADIQMSALNFPLSCMLLTKCDAPSQYVHQRATELDVPLAVVSRDTHEAAAALERVSEVVSFDHPCKIEHFTSVLEEALDMDAVRSAAGGR